MSNTGHRQPTSPAGSKHLSATDRVYESLKEKILSAELGPESVVIEHELAEMFGVSKTPVRDALRLLVHEGWVTVIPRRGYLIRGLQLDDVTEIYGLRLMVEPALASFAAERGTHEEKRTLAAILDEQKAAAEPDDAFKAGSDFHRQIAKMGRNARAEAVVHNMLEELYRIRRVAPWLDARLQEEDEFSEHEGILHAIEASDSTLAYQRMEEHSRHSLQKKIQGLSSLI